MSYRGVASHFLRPLGALVGAHIRGWNYYIIILLFYGLALIIEIGRYLRRCEDRGGWRAVIVKKGRKVGERIRLTAQVLEWFMFLYPVGGVALSGLLVVTGAQYIFALRTWVDKSGWIKLEDNENPENDATSFGQLVPLFMLCFTFFTLLQIGNGMFF